MDNQNNLNKNNGFRELSDAEIEASSIFSKPQIENKKPPKQKNIVFRTIIALGVVGLLIASALLINKFFGKSKGSSGSNISDIGDLTAVEFKAVGIDPNDITAITLFNEYGKIEFYSKKGDSDSDGDGENDNNWFIKGIDERYIDTESTALTVGDCADVLYLFERAAEDGVDYGFSKPDATINVKAKSGDYTITVGKKFINSSMEGAYLKLSTTPQKVYMLASENIDYFKKDISYYISKKAPTAVPETKNNSKYFADTLDSFDYIEMSGEMVKAGDVRIEMYGRENSNLLYKMVSPAYTHVDGEKIASMLEIMKEDLECGEIYYFNKNGIPDDVLEEYDLAKPQATITYQVGDVTTTINLSQSKKDKNYYAMVISGVPTIYKVSRMSFEFFEYGRIDFATTSVVLDNIDGLSGLSLEIPKEEYTFDISTKTTEKDGEETEELVVKYDGKTIKTDSFQSYYSYLLAITPYASETSLITEKPSDAELYVKAKLIVKEDSQDNDLTLSIYKMDSNQNRYFIELDGNAIGLCQKTMVDKIVNNIEKLISNKEIESIL